MGCLLMALLILVIAFIGGAAEAGIVWAVYKYVICSIFLTLPAIGFWSWFWILFAINIVAGAFRTKVTVKND